MERGETKRRSQGTGAVWALLLLAGCSRTVAPATPTHDAPVATAEPRAELRLALELAPSPDCEERFDLALYTEPGVELVAWDAHEGRCEARVATVRYYPRQLEREALLARVRELTVTARPIATEGTE